METRKQNKQSGQGLTEYAIVLSLVAVAAIGATAFFGGAVKGRVASLAGAVAGQSSSEIKASDELSKKAAKEAQKRSKTVVGNTTIGNEDIFDKQNL